MPLTFKVCTTFKSTFGCCAPSGLFGSLRRHPRPAHGCSTTNEATPLRAGDFPTPPRAHAETALPQSGSSWAPRTAGRKKSDGRAESLHPSDRAASSSSAQVSSPSARAQDTSSRAHGQADARSGDSGGFDSKAQRSMSGKPIEAVPPPVHHTRSRGGGGGGLIEAARLFLSGGVPAVSSHGGSQQHEHAESSVQPVQASDTLGLGGNSPASNRVQALIV